MRSRAQHIETIIADGGYGHAAACRATPCAFFTLRKGITDTVIYDEEGVYERYGFGPER